jgi:hypothetical protein
LAKCHLVGIELSAVAYLASWNFNPQQRRSHVEPDS